MSESKIKQLQRLFEKLNVNNLVPKLIKQLIKIINFEYRKLNNKISYQSYKLLSYFHITNEIVQALQIDNSIITIIKNYINTDKNLSYYFYKLNYINVLNFSSKIMDSLEMNTDNLIEFLKVLYRQTNYPISNQILLKLENK